MKSFFMVQTSTLWRSNIFTVSYVIVKIFKTIFQKDIINIFEYIFYLQSIFQKNCFNKRNYYSNGILQTGTIDVTWMSDTCRIYVTLNYIYVKHMYFISHICNIYVTYIFFHGLGIRYGAI